MGGEAVKPQKYKGMDAQVTRCCGQGMANEDGTRTGNKGSPNSERWRKEHLLAIKLSCLFIKQLYSARARSQFSPS